MRNVVCSRRPAVRLAAVASCAAIATLSLSSARANDIFWSASDSGTFSDPANWEDGLAPTANDVAHFGTTSSGAGPTYTATFGANATTLGAVVRRDNVTWDLAGKTYTLSGNATTSPLLVGTEAGGAGTLSITGGGTVTYASSTYSAIGPVPNSAGTLNVTGAAATKLTLGKLYLGGTDTSSGGTGVLNISAGTTSVGVLKVWDTPGTQLNLAGGTLSVGTALDFNGDPSSFYGDATTAGGWTGGELKVTQNAVIDSVNASSSTNLGSGVVLRAGQTLTAGTGKQYVGNTGVGTFTQTGGTNTVSQSLIVGKDATALGTYTLSGSASALAPTDLSVGDLATGTKVNGVLTQYGGTFEQSGGAVNSYNLTLGRAAGASGKYTISGGSYGTINSGTMSVGRSGIGTFVQTGGSVRSRSLYVGDLTQGIGTYSLSGASSTLTVDYEAVGNSAVGSYNAGTGIITQFGGSFDQSAGTHTAVTLTVGASGTGRFNMSGGTLATDSTVVGDTGIGQFTLSGGIHSTRSLRIGPSSAMPSSYTLSGADAALTVSTGSETVFGTFTQAAGTHTIGAGTLFLYGESNRPSTFSLVGGTLLAKGGEQIAYGGGAASFDQTGGVHVVGTPSALRPLSIASESAGTFNLSGASSTLTVYGDLQVGGRFNMSGGIATVSGALAVSGIDPQINLSGGSLSVGRFANNVVHSRFFGNGTTTGWTGGEFTLTNSDSILSSNNASLGPTLSLSGSRLFRLTGAGNSFRLSLGGTLTTPNMAIGGTFTGADQLGITSIFSQFGGSTTVSGAVQIRDTTGAQLSITGGTFNAGSISNAGTFTLGSAGTLNLTGDFTNTAGTATLGKTVNWSPGASIGVTGGTLSLAAPQNVASVNVGNGAVVNLTSGGSNVLATGTLSVSGGAKLDLTNNAMVVRSSSQSTVRSLIASAFNAGNWNGPAGGLTSSAAAGATGTAIGYAGNGPFGFSTWRGVTGLDADDVLVRYTYYGDSDLSGVTTLDDFTLFLTGYQSHGTTWFQGDYDYNGSVTLDDFTLFVRGYQQQGAPLSAIESMINAVPLSDAERAAMLAAVQSVPEPALVGVFGLTGIALLRRRRTCATPRA